MEKHVREVLSEVVNALQVAAPAAARQRETAQQSSADAAIVETAIGRAVAALRRLQPGAVSEGDR